MKSLDTTTEPRSRPVFSLRRCRAKSAENVLADGLELSNQASEYGFARLISELHPGKSVLHTEASSFDPAAYARGEQCRMDPLPDSESDYRWNWNSGETPAIEKEPRNGWFTVEWSGERLVLLIAHLGNGWDQERHAWILAKSHAVCESFFEAVCEWNSAVREEILVFAYGCWKKSKSLFKEIQSARFDNLILEGGLKEQIVGDFDRFLAAKTSYDRLGVPWKRGVLFLGPPGNGKTHTIKSLANRLGLPVLYVTSLQSPRGGEHANIHSVYERARRIAPCLLVLEDLDTMLTKANRSFFLNEMDGFAANRGILTVATCNHPEKLDPAILERPSRFDRKFTFALPSEPDRAAFLAMWNGTLDPELRMNETGIHAAANATAGFSFAYLKELVLSSVTCCVGEGPCEDMNQAILAQAKSLSGQLHLMAEAVGPGVPADARSLDDDDD
jgi:hypothetical protein